jgi:ABC-type multidrug transport system fused ATPase/permease subunit
VDRGSVPVGGRPRAFRLLVVGRSRFWSTTCSSAHAFEQLPLLIAIYLAITVGKVAVSYASTRLDASIIAQITQSVRVDLYRHAMKLSPGTIRHSIGDLLTRLSGDAERVEYLIYTGLLGLCADVLAVIVFGSFWSGAEAGS